MEIADNKKLVELKKKEQYNSYQEQLGFAKELNILRNDFYYQMDGDVDSFLLIDFLYHPLDTLSGDAYTSRKIDGFRTFYLVVDGMGKGLSASLTSMLMTSFTNHIIDKMIQHDHFDLYLLVHETLQYIKKILLEEEALSIDYIVIDRENNTINYAKFSMPPVLMQTKEGEVIRIRSNNPPMSKYQDDFKVSSHEIKNIEKFLFYSDGIVENTTICDGIPYADFIEEDFKNSFTKREFIDKMYQKMSDQEDDFTLTFINRLDFDRDSCITKKEFSTSLQEVENANEWYSNVWNTLSDDAKKTYQAGVVFTELYMNAYEHGNLGIDAFTKHQLIEEDTYIDTLLQKEQGNSKKITVTLDKVTHSCSTYIVTKITDEGEGFDTQLLSEIFRNSQAFNGRGVFVSRKNSMGIYYNVKGNTVLFLSKI